MHSFGVDGVIIDWKINILHYNTSILCTFHMTYKSLVSFF